MAPDAASAVSGESVPYERRRKDPPGFEIAQARVAARLFGSGDVTTFGRFRLVKRLGAGGMGVIYSADDPQLDRRVALKIVDTRGRDPSRALDEAKALARLSHPNVVPIFDVGISEEHVYIAMELVDGATLRTWVKGRARGEILQAYRQAGAALAAAHAAKLVHRDFKPDNAIMGIDGRVRVVDFGLACEASDPDRPDSEPRVVGGTPKYMAPEQQFRGAITAAADQYGYCASLAEALKATRKPSDSSSLPRWLQAVIERGLAADPADRFPTMNDLLAALSRDPVRRRRQWMAVGGLAALVIAAFIAGGRSMRNSRAAACGKGAELVSAAWGNAGMDGALRQLGQLGEYGRSVQLRLDRQLRDYTGRWAAGYQAACVARNGAPSNEPNDRWMACLERGRSAVKSVAALVVSADRNSVPGLVLAARELPDPDACSDLDSLTSNVDPPDRAIAVRVAEVRAQLAGARIELAAGRHAQARTSAEKVLAQARQLAYRPLIGEALLVQGHAMMSMDDRLSAIGPLTEAFSGAEEVGDQSLAVEAWARRAWTQGTAKGGAESLAGLDVIEAQAAHKLVSPFARALLHNNVGSVEVALEHREPARKAFERALREGRAVVGEGANELLNVRLNLARVTDDPDQRDALLVQVADEKSRAFGEDHPETLEGNWVRGMMSVRLQKAADILAPTCSRFEMHEDAHAMRCWAEVGFVRRELRDDAGATAALQRATSTRFEYGTTAPGAAPYLRLWQGDAAGAARDFAAAIAVLPVTESEPWWDRLQRADLELGLGRALEAAGRPRDARRALESALHELEAIVVTNPDPEIERRLGRTRADLAKVLAALHAPADQVNRLAVAAVAWMRRAGGSAQEIGALTAMSAR